MTPVCLSRPEPGDSSAVEEPPDVTHAQRARENEERFARANAAISAKADELGVDRVPFLCECSDPRCTEIISLSLTEYGAAKAQPGAFMLVAGHQVSNVERVVQDGDVFVLVQKNR